MSGGDATGSRAGGSGRGLRRGCWSEPDWGALPVPPPHWRAQLRAEIEKSSLSRDFFITLEDVKNMRDSINNASWRRAGNEATQVEQLVQELGASVFLHQSQETAGDGGARKVLHTPPERVSG